MISKDLAKYFNKEQRKAICEWCREKKCDKCGLTSVQPEARHEKNNDK